MGQRTTQRRRPSGRRGRDHPARDRADRINRNAGERLRVFRRAAGMTQSRLGACLGASFQQIQKYEKGVSGIKLGAAVLMAEALGIRVGDLVGVDAGDPHANAILGDLGQLPSGQRRAVEELIRMLRIANQ